MMEYSIEKHLFLPTSRQELNKKGWKQPDIILITGDAYVDHPAFGVAIIARVLEADGFTVAVLPQPNWRDDLRDFKKLGTPRLFFGVTAGNMDSMVNHYTANKRLRSDDAYTPGRRAGFRPDYAVDVYSKILKSLYPSVPVILGGIEASLRRLTHYDYWSDSLKPSILVTSRADLLVYGMGEQAIREIARRLDCGESIATLIDIPQTAYRTTVPPSDALQLHSYEECLQSKKVFAENFVVIEEESNKLHQRKLAEPVGSEWIVVNPPGMPLTQQELDRIYELPYTRLPHPRYWKKGPIPAFEMIKDSITIHRGCFGGCSFCTISAHQGKYVSSRSEESIVREAKTITSLPTFKGHITDLGGPSANMYTLGGIEKTLCAHCKRPSCIYPKRCPNLHVDMGALLSLYRKIRNIPGVKYVTIGSGIRYDLLFDEENKPISETAEEYFTELVRYHVSGRLKVAPEHTSEKVLRLIRKPSFKQFVNLFRRFRSICKNYGLNYQLVPYFISSLPGCTIDDMLTLALIAQRLHLQLDHVQDFTPTPMTLASVMYYTGINPYTNEKLFIPKSLEEKKVQQLFFFLQKYKVQIQLKDELQKRKRYDLLKKLQVFRMFKGTR
ncbi:MAG: YgiQ family radical SAM protein [Bacteroidetes bacterium]|nr:YgiQ family radical SAM protein [Bacteroidota bacterium]